MPRTIEEGPIAAIAEPPCTIRLQPAAVTASWPFFCTLVVHEVGHLLGYTHSTDPLSVMYPTQIHSYWRCNHSVAWTLGHPVRSGQERKTAAP